MGKDEHKGIKSVILLVVRIFALIFFLVLVMPFMLLLADPGIVEASVSPEKIDEHALEMVSNVFPDIPFEEYHILQLEMRYHEWEALETYRLIIRVNKNIRENEIEKRNYHIDIIDSGEHYTDIKLSYTFYKVQAFCSLKYDIAVMKKESGL